MNRAYTDDENTKQQGSTSNSCTYCPIVDVYFRIEHLENILKMHPQAGARLQEATTIHKPRITSLLFKERKERLLLFVQRLLDDPNLDDAGQRQLLQSMLNDPISALREGQNGSKCITLKKTATAMFNFAMPVPVFGTASRR